MKILITGATGLVGSAIRARWESQGHEVSTISRNPASGTATWENLEKGLPDCDALVHLAGENLANRRWSEAQKQVLRNSRIGTARKLLAACLAQGRFPKIYISASAVGYYGDTADSWRDEDSPRGNGFLADLCGDWEELAWEFAKHGSRAVACRFGMILSADGGPFPLLKRATRWTGGTIMGSGRQWQSWIHIDDALGALELALKDSRLEGPVNFTSPNPLPQAELARSLARALHRPTLAKAPAFALNVALGELSTILLQSSRVSPAKLLSLGYRFRNPTLDSALAALLQS